MKQTSIIKLLLILIATIVAVGIFYVISLKNDLQLEINERQKIIQKNINGKKELIDSFNVAKDNELKKLKTNIEDLSKYSKSLMDKINNYEKNPDYDIDFITAVDIITSSNYQKRRNDTIP